MSKEVTVRFSDVTVRLRVPDELAAQIGRDDVVEMAQSAMCSHEVGRGVQVVIDGAGQEDKDGEAVFADASVDADDSEYNVDVEPEDDGFLRLDAGGSDLSDADPRNLGDAAGE